MLHNSLYFTIKTTRETSISTEIISCFRAFFDNLHKQNYKTEYLILTISLDSLLFVLDSAAGLGCKVIEHAVYAFHFFGDAVYQMLHEFKGNVFHCGGHSVSSVDCTDDDNPLKGSFTVLYSCGFKIRNYGKVLPYLPSRPFFANSSRRMASDSRTASSLSLVMAPGHLTPRPGPGKG